MHYVDGFFYDICVSFIYLLLQEKLLMTHTKIIASGSGVGGVGGQ